MLQHATRWRLLAIAGGLAILFLYLFGLDRMGLYSADEPRYAAIGRTMAQNGDLITPILWGQPWFEKPPLLYWIVAGGFRAGLSEDLAPRVPVALLSISFLAIFFSTLRREFGLTAAAYATTFLATSAGWLALSGIAVTDVPMSAMFGLALLFTLPWLRTGERRWLNAAAVALGAAFLAKSGPPIVLALPILWFGRDRWRDLIRPTPVLLFLLVAAPWHIACYLRNGALFPRTLFWQHQFERFVSGSLQHVQPWWFYFKWVPVLFFPWTSVLVLLFRRDLYTDKRLQFLIATGIWGFVFFSASLNKLPFYLLPLLPPVAIVAGVALERAQLAARIVIVLSAVACCAFPFLVTQLPAIMARNPQAAAPGLPLALCITTLLITAAVCFIRNRTASIALVALSAAAGYLWVKSQTLPFVDAVATARPIWREMEATNLAVCVKDVPREFRYSLNYYTQKPLPDCGPDLTGRAFLYFQNHKVLLRLP